MAKVTVKKGVNKPTKKVCSKCTNEMAVRNFYKSQSPLFADGYVSMCKSCLFSLVDERDLVGSLKSILMKMDKPYLHDTWESTLESEPTNPIGVYIKNINSLPQYRKMSYEDSTFEDVEVVSQESPKVVISDDSIQITNELKLKWGLKYTDYELLVLEKFYKDMEKSYDMSTPQHRRLLIQLSKMNIELDKFLERGAVTEYTKMSKTYDETMKSAGFRPVDRKSSDEASGIRTFSQIFEEVEREGFIEPAPITEHKDLADETLLILLNYSRTLFSMEQLTELPPDIEKQLDDFREGEE